MSTYLEIAESIAREAHAGQTYGERDYIEAHVAPVAGFIAWLGYSEAYQATGWLHDVFEDSTITPADALQRGVPPRVARAAELLTRKGQDHEVYLQEIATDPLAIVGKFADTTFNYANLILGPKRTPHAHRKILEYAHNIAVLEPLLPAPDALVKATVQLV